MSYRNSLRSSLGNSCSLYVWLPHFKTSFASAAAVAFLPSSFFTFSLVSDTMGHCDPLHSFPLVLPQATWMSKWDAVCVCCYCWQLWSLGADSSGRAVPRGPSASLLVSFVTYFRCQTLVATASSPPSAMGSLGSVLSEGLWCAPQPSASALQLLSLPGVLGTRAAAPHPTLPFALLAFAFVFQAAPHWMSLHKTGSWFS